jgi:hypothetical protein
MPIDELKAYDVVCLTGGRTSYLLERINAQDSGIRCKLNTAAMLIRNIPDPSAFFACPSFFREQ